MKEGNALVMQGRRLASVALRATALQGKFDVLDGKASGHTGLRHHVGNRRSRALQAVGAVTAYAFEMTVLSMCLCLGFHMLGQAKAIDTVIAGVLVREMLLDQPVENPVDRHAVHRFAGCSHLFQHSLVGQRMLTSHEAGQDLHARLRDTGAQVAQAITRRIGQTHRGMIRMGLHRGI